MERIRGFLALNFVREMTRFRRPDPPIGLMNQVGGDWMLKPRGIGAGRN
jgi:hypothetical protein